MLTLNELEQDFEEEGSTKPLAKALKAFLGNWLVKHIRSVDQQFGAYLADNDIVLSDQN
jgi:hemerythrin